MELSARNQLKGKVVDIKEGSVNAKVVIDIGNGNKLTSTISLDAVKQLALKVGSDATAIIKATSIMIGA